MGYAQNVLENQLAINRRNNDFGSFDVNNINPTQMNKLRNDIYGGYKSTISDTYGRTGKNTYGVTGTKSSLNSNYYQTHAGWSSIGNKLGISNINSENDVRQMYDFVNGYRPPAPAAAAAAPAAPRAQGTSSVNFSNQLAAIKAQNQESINALTKQLTDQKADYDAREQAANKRISNLSSTVANAQSQYDPTKDMSSSNNINPALTIQEKTKSLSSGTERYNRNKLSINNVNV
jgi:hypothetical protein